MTESRKMTEAGWNFDNSYARLPHLLFEKVDPTPVKAPKLVAFNESLATSLGLNKEALQHQAGAEIFAGNTLPQGAAPLAQAYAGHQFGHLTMLGDGRAILLGEQMTSAGERVDVQLKGAGRTPYSRRGDGRATLGPMLREYIISEAMHALGIPTTRSLAVVTTGEDVVREAMLPGAVLTRVAQSHLRVGTFQFVAQVGTIDDLRTLADYALTRHFPEIEAADEQRYLALLQAVCKRQAALIAKWQLVGFIHGVMNTDNMTISGETIDYGPCAFMDTYDSATVFSSIDVHGRYAYGNQPQIGAWNLARFAEALLPLLHEDQDEAVKRAEAEISRYAEAFEAQWLTGMRAKLGLLREEKEDRALINELLTLMQKHEADFTNTFRALTLDDVNEANLDNQPAFKEWYARWQTRLEREQASAADIERLMKQSNPAVIPRNHQVEAALKAAVEEDDTQVMTQLLAALDTPFAHTCEKTVYTAPPLATAPPYRTFCGT
ncbi:protein adenylyltransferase SelO [Shouchella lonarensis]|uniref:Protein nucleotidyltransferase YdiU n=1 Tax=Shouchella lonarensis TaxID=1464122 RepID=A0A1G6HDE9_9BACI|nr:YdiU family protein [Shouchella lonarensis]SDB92309.1 Uncharacterized conserved protein YdiU, UPF0061 family [Shouchella lonarensis]